MTTLLGLDLRDRLAVVAGGGPVAAVKVALLLEAGARIRVIAPALCEDLVDAFAAHRISWEMREVIETDLDGAWLVVAATGDRAADEAVCRWATAARTWSINAGSGQHGTARSPALLRRAGLAIGIVSQESPDPRRIVVLRDELAAVPDLVKEGDDPNVAIESVDAVIASAAVDLRHRRPRPGRVTLVGGGPGAEDLMTVRGRIALSEADVVITDRLGPRSVLGRLPVDVEVIHVGKVPGGHGPTQAEINALLIEQAQRGRHVVRLKGGDPFLFGRGGEEVIACREHGIPVEVVPGVSSALSVPAIAGIPVTHRGTASSVTIAHGHHRLSPAAYAPVADGTTTLVLLMAVTLLADHVADALAAGVPPQTPVCIVERGTLPDERCLRARLDGVVDAAERADLQAPAIIVVGAVADPRLLAAVADHSEAAVLA